MLIGTGVAAAAATGAGAYLLRHDTRPIAGAIIGAPAKLGHRLREHDFPAPSAERSVDAVVVGSGIAGMSAARDLSRHGVRDLIVLETSDMPGGNAAYGKNAISAYPWGAHYVPLARNDDIELMALYKEMGIIVDLKDGVPIYNEYFLSADLQERLSMYGRWQEGLVPMLGVSQEDQAEYRRFFALTNQLKTANGTDGKPLFCIPISGSSSDPNWRALDQITMSEYLTRERFNSRPLRWYIDYCCRDDYGAPADRVSAWAGLHYFAARNGRAANADATTVVTWPEGNGFFTRAWTEELGKRIELNSLVFAIARSDDGVTLDYFDAITNRTIRVRARAVILALPQFIVERILSFASNSSTQQSYTDKADKPAAAATEYSPWVVANLTLSARPGGIGVDLAWDNVSYNSPMLGYVVADHQAVSRPRPETVITYYWPLCHSSPSEARREALARSHYDWQVLIENDLYRMHPELRGHVQHMDVMAWGHGMIRPTPNTIWNERRAKASVVSPPIFVAHSDLSGISIFEEAFHRGVDAARQCQRHLAPRSTVRI